MRVIYLLVAVLSVTACTQPAFTHISKKCENESPEQLIQLAENILNPMSNSDSPSASEYKQAAAALESLRAKTEHCLENVKNNPAKDVLKTNRMMGRYLHIATTLTWIILPLNHATDGADWKSPYAELQELKTDA